MPDIHIQRAHTLGLPKARKLARKWAEQAQDKFALECKIVEGATEDTVEFTRPGVDGSLRVAADQITVDAKLGFLLAAFSKQIEGQIAENIDALLSPDRPAPRT
ncbi:MAG TPA: polyhydroxyalkanoic acid system family protein [Burkholderiaceae bacterium]|jgi:putative polyhydroxyalkanoate system protein